MKQKRRFLLLLALCAAWMAFALLGRFLAPHDPYATSAAAIRMPPSGEFPLGTDSFGRCVLSRVLYGAGVSVCASLGLVAAAALLGSVVGILCGYFGGVLDSLFMRIADVLLAFPQMVVAIAVAGVLGGGIGSALIALGFTAWPQYARLARSHVLLMRRQAFLQAARLSGEGHAHILLFHVLPNCVGPLAVNAAVQLGGAMTGLAGLSFLGLGAQVPQAEWGSMASESFAYLQLAPWAVLAPSAAVVLTVALFNLLGDAARDCLDGGSA